MAHLKVRAFTLKEFCCFCRISLLVGFGCLLFSGAGGLKLQYCHTNIILLLLDNVYINVNFSTDLYLILSVWQRVSGLQCVIVRPSIHCPACFSRNFSDFVSRVVSCHDAAVLKRVTKLILHFFSI